MSEVKAKALLAELIASEVESGEISGFLKDFLSSERTTFDTNTLYFEKVTDSDLIEVDAVWGGSEVTVSRSEILDVVLMFEKRAQDVPRFRKEGVSPLARRKKGKFRR